MNHGPGTDGGWTLVAGHQPVMGTHLDLQITAPSEVAARAADDAAVAEAARLQAMFTVFEPGSELCQWRSGSVQVAGPELAALLALAERWQQASGGTFNPMAGLLAERWLGAVTEGSAPSDQELTALADTIATPRFSVVDGVAVQRGDCAVLDLNAIAKGHVADRVAAHLIEHHGVSRLVVNAGGDLVHRGAGTLRVAVEDPHRPHDNAPPLLRIEVANAAVATSGLARRWFSVGGTRYSRVLDPRTGQPVAHTASATVVAPDAATADVLATVATVLPPVDAIGFVDTLRAEGADVACLVVAADGTCHRSTGWAALER